MNKAIYAGTFDPLTNGHIDIIKRASRIFPEIIVGIAESTNKKTLFSSEERFNIAEKAVKNIENVNAVLFSGLLAEFSKKENCNIIIRGMRAVTDFEYEFQMALANNKLYSELETFFMITSTENAYLSSSLVKEIARCGGSVKTLVPDFVEVALKGKFNEK